MQCGNIKYGSSYGGEGAKIENPEVIEKISELWGLNKEVFEKSLIKPRVQAGREIVEKHLTKVEASYAREALCKSLYERAFLWIVKKLNRVLASPTEANFIGVLDIAGFEIFENNSFEQLCINYTNEKLQQFFNNHMFKLEQEEYEREKITWTYIDFGLDSVQTIELIDKKDSSIIALLDEETIFPRATDESLIMKLNTLSKKHPKYSEVQFKKLNFQIQHYAGDVVVQRDGLDHQEQGSAAGGHCQGHSGLEAAVFCVAVHRSRFGSSRASGSAEGGGGRGCRQEEAGGDDGSHVFDGGVGVQGPAVGSDGHAARDGAELYSVLDSQLAEEAAVAERGS